MNEGERHAPGDRTGDMVIVSILLPPDAVQEMAVESLSRLPTATIVSEEGRIVEVSILKAIGEPLANFIASLRVESAILTEKN